VKNLARVPLAKVWANSVRGQNPKWPLSAILNSFFTDLANPVFQYIISGLLRGEEYIFDIISMIFSCFDLQIQDGRRQ